MTGEVLSLDYHSTNLTFDVITAVTMAYDADAQRLHPSQQGTIVQTMKQLVKSKLFFSFFPLLYYSICE